MRIALYGGSFDPVHNGHLLLARDAVEQLGLDRMIFLPAGRSPHKLHREPLPASIRLELLRSATAGEPGFFVDDRELRRKGVSFTIDTVREFLAEFPNAEFFYLIGQDNLRELHTWKEIETLTRLVSFVVLSRPGETASCDFPMIRRDVEISSTEIRDRLARGASVRYLVPDACIPLLESCTKPF